MSDAVRELGELPQRRASVLVYRHRLAPLSEAQFLRRQYIGFKRLKPIWVGCRTDKGLSDLGAEPLILGRPGVLGILDRFSFKQFGLLPVQPDLAELRPSIVHAQFGRGGALALPIARALGVPLVVTFHGGDATKNKHYVWDIIPTIFQRRLRALQREAAQFICVSQFIADKLIARGFPADKIRTIRLGVDIDAAFQGEPPADPPYVLFVGRFVEKKGILDLLEAARILGSEGSAVRFVLVGDGPLTSRLKQRARSLSNITFTGWVSLEEVQRYMRKSIALCAPSVVSRSGDADGLPTVILEAMANGVPVVGSAQAGIAEAVEHGKTGLLVPSGSPRELADAIRAIVERPDRGRGMGAAGREAAEQRFDAAHQSRLLEEALIEVIQRSAHEQ